MSSAFYLVPVLPLCLQSAASSLNRVAISLLMVSLAAGVGIGLLPVGDDALFDPIKNHAAIEQVTQFAVLLALMEWA